MWETDTIADALQGNVLFKNLEKLIFLENLNFHQN